MFTGSLTRSRTPYDVPVAQSPRQLPMSSPTVGLPLESNASVLPARDSWDGKVMLILVGSVTGALMDRSAVSATCCTKIVCESISSLSVLANKSPPVTKSVVRSIALAPTIVIRSEPVAATTRVTDPVPLLLIVTV